MRLEEEAIQFVKRLQELYLEQRDVDALLLLFDGDISWIGTGRQEICDGPREARRALTAELREYDAGFTITDCHYKEQRLTDTVCLVYGELTASGQDPEIADIFIRLSAVCVHTESGIRLLHLHASCPCAEQGIGEYFPKTSTVEKREMWRDHAEAMAEALRSRERELAALIGNVPGGVFKCRDDDHLTITSMSDGFLSLFGYTRADIETRFQDHFLEMVHPDDIQELKEKLDEQQDGRKDLELEYRVRCRDGKDLWVLDKGKLVEDADGTRSYYSILLDVTEQREEREKLRLSLERHQMIMDQTTDIIFEWNIQEDTLTFSQNWQKKFGYEPVRSQISLMIPQSLNIHPEDMTAFVKIMMDAMEGIPYSETEFRIRDVMGHFTWCRIRATTQYDSGGRPARAVGVIIDIEAEKRQQQDLLAQAQKDALTGLYNKTACRQRVEDCLRGRTVEPGALILMDLDNFKNLNDRYGHLYGDTVLSDTANVLRNHFRASDVVGRIGGDEFLIYLAGISKEKSIEMMESLVRRFADIETFDGLHEISCSLGASFFPADGDSFYTLYNLADIALYHVKNRGKGGCAAYDASMQDGKAREGRGQSAINTRIDSDSGMVSPSHQMAQYCFRMLYNTGNIERALSQILEIIGHAYDVSRVYIFENSQDGKRCSNTFEWCAKGVKPEIEHLKNLSYDEDLPGVREMFLKDGVINFPDIRDMAPNLRVLLEPQGVQAMLQCSVKENDVFLGFIGFDECKGIRPWTEDQISSLTLTAHVIGTFLLKHRMKQKLCRLEKKEKTD